jgi:hypothetical protein
MATCLRQVAIFCFGSRRGGNLLWTSELVIFKIRGVERFFPI